MHSGNQRLLLIRIKILKAMFFLILKVAFAYQKKVMYMQVQRRQQLMRRHFGQAKRARSNYSYAWFLALIGTFVCNLFLVLIMFAPSLAIVNLRYYDDMLSLVKASFV